MINFYEWGATAIIQGQVGLLGGPTLRVNRETVAPQRQTRHHHKRRKQGKDHSHSYLRALVHGDPDLAKSPWNTCDLRANSILGLVADDVLHVADRDGMQKIL